MVVRRRSGAAERHPRRHRLSGVRRPRPGRHLRFEGPNGESSPRGFRGAGPCEPRPDSPKGTALHWVQVIADNYKNPSFGGDLNTGYGKSENIVDVTNTNKTPYYDLSYTADSLNFFDAPSRDNQANLDQSDSWIAQLFLAAGP